MPFENETKSRISTINLSSCDGFSWMETFSFLSCVLSILYIQSNLNLIKDYKGLITDEMYSAIENFIDSAIRPIVYDTNYFDFIKRDEYGEYDENGHFIINSDRSLEMMIFLLYERTLELREQLDEFASEYLSLNIK